MEKMIYCLSRPTAVAVEDFRATLLKSVVSDLRQHGASNITINIADLNDVIEEKAPGRLMGPWQDVAAVVAFWHASLDARGPIETCLQEENFYRYADPLADVIVNMAEEGPGFPWHFDTNNFTVTLAIQNAEEGGAFEYAPAIRDNQGNENFDDVAAVLDGRSEKVRTLKLQPGDLQLFRGRYSLHRVAPLKGPTPRYVAILSYVEEPDMVATPERAKQLYGRVLPVHLERAGMRADTLID